MQPVSSTSIHRFDQPAIQKTPAQILIVEDSKNLSALIRDQLIAFGYSVLDTVSSGEQALQKVAEHSPDLILMDINLEGDMDGVETANQILELIDVPIVYLTAYADVPTRERAKATFPFGFLLKPFKGIELQTAVEMALVKHRMERELRWEKRWLATVVRNIGDAVIATDADGRVQLMNSTAERIFNRKETDVLMQPIEEILCALHDARGNALGVRFLDMFNGHNLISLNDCTLLRADGVRVPIEGTAVLIKDDAFRNTIGIVVAFRDVSERKEAEKILAASNEELRKAREQAEEHARLLEIQAKELREAREIAEEAAQLKADFMASMSHEIRTPLNAVIGAADLLLASAPTEKQREYASIISKSGKALLALVNDILDFSRHEAGKVVLESVEFDVREIVEEAVIAAAQRAQEKNVELGCVIRENVPQLVRGDPTRLRQVLLNLVDNGVKFTEQGEVFVEAIAVSESESHAAIRFTISDTGIGITEETIAKLFSPFVQADGSTTRRYGGSGLGLAISKHIIELYNGVIKVASEPGKGSEFWFELQLEKATTCEHSEPQRATFDGKSALIVDSSRSRHHILSYYLQSWGLQTTEVNTTDAALAELRRAARKQQPYDIVFLDAQLGDKAGNLARWLREGERQSHSRLVVLATLGNKQASTLVDTDDSAVLTTPIRRAALFESLCTILQAPASVSAQAVDRHGEEPEQILKYNRSKYRVLAVEDNEVNQAILVGMLQELGYQFDVVGDGKKAVEAVERHRYDVVLMDCHLPEIDGWEATFQIRQREGDDRYTRIIALTADALYGDKERCFAAGMDDYISKPVQLQALKTVLDKWTIHLSTFTPPPKFRRPAAGNETRTINRERLDELRQLGESGEESVLQKTIEIFFRKTPQLINQLQVAIRNADAKSIESVAHALRGSCSNVGAERMADLSRVLQTMARTRSLAGADDIVSKLEAEYRYAARDLQDELQKTVVHGR